MKFSRLHWAVKHDVTWGQLKTVEPSFCPVWRHSLALVRRLLSLELAVPSWTRRSSKHLAESKLLPLLCVLELCLYSSLSASWGFWKTPLFPSFWHLDSFPAWASFKPSFIQLPELCTHKALLPFSPHRLWSQGFSHIPQAPGKAVSLRWDCLGVPHILSWAFSWEKMPVLGRKDGIPDCCITQ